MAENFVDLKKYQCPKCKKPVDKITINTPVEHREYKTSSGVFEHFGNTGEVIVIIECHGVSETKRFYSSQLWGNHERLP